jgi:hypothetical protein
MLTNVSQDLTASVIRLVDMPRAGRLWYVQDMVGQESSGRTNRIKEDICMAIRNRQLATTAEINISELK